MSKIDQVHLRAVILCMSKMSKMGQEHTHTFLLITSRVCQRHRRFMLHAVCSVQNNVEDIKTSHNRFLTDFLEFISLLSQMSKMCMNYNVDSNMKSSNYSKIQLNP